MPDEGSSAEGGTAKLRNLQIQDELIEVEMFFLTYAHLDYSVQNFAFNIVVLKLEFIRLRLRNNLLWLFSKREMDLI